MSFFSFLDQHPTKVPTRRPVDADEAMTDWIREDRQARHERVSRNIQRAKMAGALALSVTVIAGATVAAALGLGELGDHAVAGTEHFNRANAGDIPAQVAAQTADNESQAIARAHTQ